MCNRYKTETQESSLRKIAASLGRDLVVPDSLEDESIATENYPDQDAWVLRTPSASEAQAQGKLELIKLRWGFPEVKNGAGPITNIRNLESSWWQKKNGEYLLEPEYRCLVPFSSFAEPVRNPTWFARCHGQPGFFAGIWKPWRGERLIAREGQARRSREERNWQLFAFLTTEANSVVKPVHEKAMPVILTEADEYREWLGGGKESLRLQRPLDDGLLTVET